MWLHIFYKNQIVTIQMKTSNSRDSTVITIFSAEEIVHVDPLPPCEPTWFFQEPSFAVHMVYGCPLTIVDYNVHVTPPGSHGWEGPR